MLPHLRLGENHLAEDAKQASEEAHDGEGATPVH
jgi:hypothetical protein